MMCEPAELLEATNWIGLEWLRKFAVQKRMSELDASVNTEVPRELLTILLVSAFEVFPEVGEEKTRDGLDDLGLWP